MHAAKKRKYKCVNKQWMNYFARKRGLRAFLRGAGRLTETPLCYIICPSILGHLRTVPGCLQWPYFWPSIYLMKELSAQKSKTSAIAGGDNCIAIMLMPRAVCKRIVRVSAQYSADKSGVKLGRSERMLGQFPCARVITPRYASAWEQQAISAQAESRECGFCPQCMVLLASTVPLMWAEFSYRHSRRTLQEGLQKSW